MKALSSRVLVILTAGLVVGLSGCATVTTEQLNEAMTMARQAQSDAASAKQAATSAARAAEEAKRTASAAQSAAAAAQSAASQANNCCTMNSEKIERMFKESMRK
ncbi:MAG: hypothetical protein HKN49_09455 [Gammaproteobacteria bacterium]|nr:hypothetical protein [Gammaproteobacteria bacterium]